MKDRINALIKGINDTLDWFRVNRPDQFENQFRSLAPKRLELRTICETLDNNPGIAAYGESQKGKSYLMSNLLQDNGHPFMIKGSDGSEYNYVSELNPPGDGQEATGVVTRFTSFNNDTSRYSSKYPVLMKVFKVHEVVSILTDAYHFDVSDYEQWSSVELDSRTSELIEKYGSRQDIQSIVVEDDILAIKEYLTNYVNGAQLIYKSDYLDTLARLIRKVRIDELHEVFAPLWHMEPEVSGLFVRLLEILEKLDFADEIYLPIDAIEHKQIKPRTIMSVQCLQGLYIPKFEYRTNAYLRRGKEYVEFADINRSHLSAICREVVLKVEDRYLKCKMRYDTAMIPESTLSRLSRKEFTRDLLNHADLLDFPGARNRERLKRANLKNVDANTGEHNMIKLLLRGKIAYLFNHYNSARALNLLMFCHDTANVGVTEMYQVIENWIGEYVGKTPAARAKTIRECGGIPPFFVISTKFNQDMVENNQDPNKNIDEALKQRWINRFSILYKDSFHAGTDVEWFKSWDAVDSKFNNIFVLRDFKYSATGGDGSNLYNGFGPNNPHEEEMAITETHFSNMRRTFIELLSSHNVLKNMVADPDLAWDLTATINNDGSVYIIDRLTTVASNLPSLRIIQFEKIVNDTKALLNQLLDNIYINPEGRDIIRETRKQVGAMRLAFDSASNTDNYFFGRLIETLQLNIRESYIVIQKAINDSNLTERVHGSHDWEIVRKLIENCTTKEECQEVLMHNYGCATVEELYDMTRAAGLDIDSIIDCRMPSPRVSDVLSERVIKAWIDKLNNPSTTVTACGDVLDKTAFGILRDKIGESVVLSGLESSVANMIVPLVDVNNLATVNQYQVADTISVIINEFVKDWGYSLLNKTKIDELRGYDAEYKLNIFKVLDENRESNFDEDSLTALFAHLTANKNGLSESFYSNYRQWFAFLTLAILRMETEVGVIIKDPEANDAVGRIIETLKHVN